MNLLRCLIGGNPRQWDSVIPHAEFACNSRINRSTGKSHFQTVYGVNPKGVVDLVDLPISPHNNHEATHFLENIKEVQQQFRLKLQIHE